MHEMQWDNPSVDNNLLVSSRSCGEAIQSPDFWEHWTVAERESNT